MLAMMEWQIMIWVLEEVTEKARGFSVFEMVIVAGL